MYYHHSLFVCFIYGWRQIILQKRSLRGIRKRLIESTKNEIATPTWKTKKHWDLENTGMVCTFLITFSSVVRLAIDNETGKKVAIKQHVMDDQEEYGVQPYCQLL